MSSWSDFDLSTASTDNEVLPEGQRFNFELLPGTKYNPWNPSRVDVGARVADGEFAGRTTYFTYPDPKEQPWVVGVFARMGKALGIAIEPNEDPVAYLNRAAGSKFSAPVKHRKVDQDGIETQKAEVKIGSVGPVRG